MQSLTALRLYCHSGARVPKKTFWHKLTAPLLTDYLANHAKDFGIEQVVVHRVSMGFLKGDSLQHNHHEIPFHKLPQCIELIDKEDKLRSFLLEHINELRKVRIIFLQCEEFLPEKSIIA